MNNLSLDKQFYLFLNEAIDKRILISIAFAIISITVIVSGVYWPKIYESKASILWTNYDPTASILQRGVAVVEQVGIRDQVELAKEIILSNNTLDQLIVEAELDYDEKTGTYLDKRNLEILKGELRSSIAVFNTGGRLIEISYRHPNPGLAYLVVNFVSDMLLKETRNVKNKMSQGAYDFIDRQVTDYKNKLDVINKKIIDFRKQNVDLDSDTRLGVNTRVNNLKSTIRETRLNLTEAQVQKKSLKNQLAIERNKIKVKLQTKLQLASTKKRESALSERLKTLETNLDTLRLSYTENYPDIVQLKEQIKNLKDQIRDKGTRETGDIQGTDEGTSNTLDLSQYNFVESALYTQLAGEIADVETLIETREARVKDTRKRLNDELQRANKVNTLESQLEEMTRDLNVTQNIYDDLLTRRENAKVSLNLQLENQGSTFKIQEPPIVPLVPVGFRFLHFVLGSMPLGLLVPLGIIYGLLLIDTRIRHEDYIDPQLMGLPVIGTVAHYPNHADRSATLRTNIITAAILGITLIAVGTLIVLKLKQLIGA